MANKERLTDVLLGALIALVVSEAFDVFGVTDRVNSTLENIKDNLQDNRA